jgi:hypothetical protein
MEVIFNFIIPLRKAQKFLIFKVESKVITHPINLQFLNHLLIFLNLFSDLIKL